MSVRLVGYQEPNLAPSQDGKKRGRNCMDSKSVSMVWPWQLRSLSSSGHWLLVAPQGGSGLWLSPQPNYLFPPSPLLPTACLLTLCFVYGSHPYPCHLMGIWVITVWGGRRRLQSLPLTVIVSSVPRCTAPSSFRPFDSGPLVIRAEWQGRCYCLSVSVIIHPGCVDHCIPTVFDQGHCPRTIWGRDMNSGWYLKTFWHLDIKT